VLARTAAEDDGDPRLAATLGRLRRALHAPDPIGGRTGQYAGDMRPATQAVQLGRPPHDPDEPLILHRKKIVQRKGVFGVLNDDTKRALFDKAVLRTMKVCEYRVITAVIDKLEASKKAKWREKHPYHYVMQILTEKFSRLLDRVNDVGDIMPEGRKGRKDALLQEAYEEVRKSGNYYYSPAQIRHRIPSGKLKFRYKQDNIAGLQLADLLAHPSYISIVAERKSPVSLGTFGSKVEEVLMATKYDRSVYGSITGYGRKFLP